MSSPSTLPPDPHLELTFVIACLGVLQPVSSSLPLLTLVVQLSLSRGCETGAGNHRSEQPIPRRQWLDNLHQALRLGRLGIEHSSTDSPAFRRDHGLAARTAS